VALTTLMPLLWGPLATAATSCAVAAVDDELADGETPVEALGVAVTVTVAVGAGAPSPQAATVAATATTAKAASAAAPKGLLAATRARRIRCLLRAALAIDLIGVVSLASAVGSHLAGLQSGSQGSARFLLVKLSVGAALSLVRRAAA
jgi:hypothetical protein